MKKLTLALLLAYARILKNAGARKETRYLILSRFISNGTTIPD